VGRATKGNAVKLHIGKRRPKGAALVEYVVLMGLIAVVMIFAIVQLGAGVRVVFDGVNSEVVARIDIPDTGPGGGGSNPPGPTPPASFYFPPFDDPNDFTMPAVLALNQNVSFEGAYGWRDRFVQTVQDDPTIFGLTPNPDPSTVCDVLPTQGEIDACYVELFDLFSARTIYAATFYDAWSAAAAWTNPDPMSTGIGLFGNYAQGTDDQLLATGGDTNVDDGVGLLVVCANDPLAASSARVELWGTDASGNRLEGGYDFSPVQTIC
jgi:Flp pilus assembly pilin Flp